MAIKAIMYTHTHTYTEICIKGITSGVYVCYCGVGIRQDQATTICLVISHTFTQCAFAYISRTRTPTHRLKMISVQKQKKQTTTKNMQELQQFNHAPPMKIK